MIKRIDEIKVTTEGNKGGKVKMFLSDLRDFNGLNEKVSLYALIRLLPGEEVEFHVHTGETEIYYILSGKALYDDNGEKLELDAGDVTFTPDGSGHGIKNIGQETLRFMALVVKN